MESLAMSSFAAKQGLYDPALNANIGLAKGTWVAANSYGSMASGTYSAYDWLKKDKENICK